MLKTKQCLVVVGVFVIGLTTLTAQKATIPPIGATAGGDNPPCGANADFSNVIQKASALASGFTGGTVKEQEIQDFIKDSGIVKSGASNCAFTCRLVEPDDQIWFFMNNEPHPWSCNGTRSHIPVNFSAASNIFSKKAGQKFLVCSTFKNWSHTNTFTGEIQANPGFNWPPVCKNDPKKTNTPRGNP